jgi:hypothetical protein
MLRAKEDAPAFARRSQLRRSFNCPQMKNWICDDKARFFAVVSV